MYIVAFIVFIINSAEAIIFGIQKYKKQIPNFFVSSWIFRSRI